MSDYQVLTGHGHSGAKALEIILDAKRGDAWAIRWIKTIRKLRGLD
jgi:hypothetical protein